VCCYCIVVDGDFIIIILFIHLFSPIKYIRIYEQLVLHYRDEVLECESEFSSLHNLLVHLTKRPCGVPFESILAQADHWMTVIPPRALKAVMARGDLRDLLVNNK